MQKSVAKMQAAVLTSPRQATIERIPIPEPEPHGVRIRLEGCGVCGSNLAPWEGRSWFTYPFAPGEPGHEGWGIVDAVGAGVTKVRPGERVASLAFRSYAEFDLAPEDHVVPLPSRLNGHAFPGEALGCAWNVFERSKIQDGQTVAVLGVGFLGALLVQLAAKAGAKVVAVSRRPVAREMARQFGALATFGFDPPHRVIEQVKEFTGGAGCDCVIEAVGLQEPLTLGAELARESGRLVIAGYHQDGMRQVNMQLWNWRGLEIVNAHERDARVCIRGMRAAAQAVEQGRLDPAPLFSHQFSLHEIDLAFEAMRLRPNDFMKALIRL